MGGQPGQELSDPAREETDGDGALVWSCRPGGLKCQDLPEMVGIIICLRVVVLFSCVCFTLCCLEPHILSGRDRRMRVAGRGKGRNRVNERGLKLKATSES